MSKLKDFYKGTTKRFDVSFTVDSVIPSIINDTVSVVFKTSKGSDAVLTSEADVTTSGASGIAKFLLSNEDNNISHGKYYYEIIWELENGEIYVVDSGTVSILERI